ncbi:MAG TPA: endo-1,4-beta-xylanase [Candidatus Marinimicrobia bacterium]|nr:endo-1,4-beta-xylanase [Candidatus Neomarinimicrobiota bacterium]
MSKKSKMLAIGKVFVTCLLLVFTAINLNAQLVTNGSFEATDLGVVSGRDVDGWVIEKLAGSADFEIIDSVVQHGNQALKVVVTEIGSNQWDLQIVADSIPVVPGGNYRFTVWAKARRAGAQVNFTVGNYSYSEYAAIRPANLTTTWTAYTKDFTITDNETVIRAPIHFSYSANVGNEIYIDNFRIVYLDEIKKPVVVEAESGVVGSDFSILEEDSITYVTIQTNLAAYNPGSSARVISYEVTFPDTGSYDLFVRLRTGAETFNDDSFFYGKGFGEKDPSVDSVWVCINGLAAAGFSGPNEIVRDAGGLGSGVWKWVNLSRNVYQGSVESLVTFIVDDPDSLTQTFQIGAREDGLDIDKIAFGKSYLYYTVGNLDNREPGSTKLPGEVWEGPPLAHKQPKFVGNIYSSSQISNFEAYWNQVTPENAGKWGSVEGTRDVMNWSGLDAAYKLAKDNGFPFHFHVLVWGAQQPSWINDLTPEEQLEEIREWFEAVAERYPDIDFLEVVNEPLPGHNPPDGTSGRANYKEALGGNGETGWDWVIKAFEMAREIFPEGTRLMINDYNIISSSSSTSQYLKLIRLLQERNLIDIIGEQGHAFTTTAAVATMKKNLDSLASTGLPIQITELDIDGPSDAVQLQSYQRIFPTLYEHPGVEGITLWGWRRGLWRDEQGAYLINQDGSERPALVWLRTYLDTLNLNVMVKEDIINVLDEFSLGQNYPNPFNPTTTINYHLPTTSHLTIKMYNLLGKEVATLVDDVKQAGSHSVTFDGSGLAGGVYLYQLKTANYTDTKKCLFLK